MIASIYNEFVSQAEAALGVTCVKGFPAWGRPAQTPPIAALEMTGLRDAAIQRIGGTRHVLSLTFYVFAEHEPGLGLMLDNVLALIKTLRVVITIAGQNVTFRFTDGQRHENRSEVQQENHGFFWSIEASFDS